MATEPKIGDLRVWHIPQVPMKPFHVPVATPDEAKKILDVLAKYDLFQYEHNVKPDYCNAAGLEIYEADDGDGKPGWSEWYDPETGDEIDDWESQA